MTERDYPEKHRWACLTLRDDLPSEGEQIAGARSWGVDATSGRLLIDDVRNLGRTTRWDNKLPNRALLLREIAAQPSSEVYFRSPLCLGFSEKHAREMVEAVWGAGGMVYVQTMMTLYSEGDDISALLARVSLEERAARQRRARDRKRKHDDER